MIHSSARRYHEFVAGSRKPLAPFCLAAVLLAALTIAPAFALVAWILVTSAFFLDVPGARERHRVTPDRAPVLAPPISCLAPRAPPAAA